MLTYAIWQHETHLEVFNPHDIVLHNEILGRGGEGIVQKATVFYNEIPVNAAVKTVLTDSDDDITMTLDEIEMLWFVSCCNFVYFSLSCWRTNIISESAHVWI